MNEAELVRPIVQIILRELCRAEEHAAFIQRLMGEAHAVTGHDQPSVSRDYITVAEQALRTARVRIQQWNDTQAIVIPLCPTQTTLDVNARRPQADTA